MRDIVATEQLAQDKGMSAAGIARSTLLFVSQGDHWID
jgi:hypothetical protein